MYTCCSVLQVCCSMLQCVDGDQQDVHVLQSVAECVDEEERWGAWVETQKNVRGEIGGWGRVPCNQPYAPSLSTIYDGA